MSDDARKPAMVRSDGHVSAPVEPGACADTSCPVLHRDPEHPIHPPTDAERRLHRHLIVRHVHPGWHGHCDPEERGYKPCDQPHWHIWWSHAHAPGPVPWVLRRTAVTMRNGEWLLAYALAFVGALYAVVGLILVVNDVV